MRKQLVLAIDDESETLELIQEVLGGSYDVWAFQNPRKGLAKAISTPPDLLLLDIDMPGLNGFQICEKFRAAHPRRPTPVIFLTSDMEASSMQRALKAGANDYLIKPFRIADLLGRIRFRLGQVELALVLCLGNLTLDPSSQSVLLGKRTIHLTRGGFRILQILVQSQGRVVPRGELQNFLRGGTRSVDIHILRLRRLLAEWDHSLEAIYGQGYRVTRRSAFLKIPRTGKTRQTRKP
ncbi:MAG: hypothetical protein A2Z97_15175 [Bdellovibrionales bacterium GWB1_52_6]|nr:MAG: hypothetical protein A2Z97_15175 [Bdellovibrionales bacterium GWB1_52_6]OFZ03890.1 MAG: hypothetical protein A2X97_15945 [Bdellovibrionales bacterium GWA1_52_35]HCM39675.1 hypothetical protein [Bdellovibrionales bacterium]